MFSEFSVFTDVSSELLLFMQLLIHVSHLIFLINLMHTIYLPYLMHLIQKKYVITHPDP